ncbi:MAG: PaaI family thioesterase [Acidobacteria bacterium]|nr:PaaI family thioesterase [Acidobacteriota bacterium]MCL5286832.1 PaaI family thioesterase [Acidobacteriota bacterium]
MRAHLSKLARMAESEFARRIRDSNSGRLFGFQLESAEPGRAVILMRVRPKHRQVHGVVHGGILAALADTSAGVACYMLLPRGTRLATIEMKINYLEPVEKGTIRAEARVLRKGRTTAVAECDVRDTSGLLVAKALLTFSIGRSETKS